MAFEARPVATLADNNGTGEGLRIASFDGGGPGSYSQLLMLKEIIRRLEWDIQSERGIDNDEELDFDEDMLCPADYFEMMSGVGFGAYCSLMLGRLRFTIRKATDELIKLAHAVFPNAPNEILTPEANSDRLKGAVEDMLRRNDFRVDIPLKGKVGNGRQCKVVIFIQATSTPGNCTPFRTYLARSSSSPKCTFVEAACAAMSSLPDFSPLLIGPPMLETLYAGIPLGFNNPTRKVLNEAFVVFGEQKPVSLILSLGAGKRPMPSIHLYASLHGNHVSLETRLAMDSERVNDEIALQLTGVDLYLRLDVDKGLEDTKISDWHQLGVIGAHAQSYLDNGSTTGNIDKALRSLRAKEYLTFAQLNGAARHAVSRVPMEQILNGLGREFKDMRDIVMQSVEKITIVDAIGHCTSIPLEYCATYEMLQDMIKFYFKHQKAPGNTFVTRGQYKLVYGEDRRTVKQSEWTYLHAPNLTLEMSMVTRIGGVNGIRCPKCNVEFHGRGKNGWAICPNQMCKMRYQYRAKPFKLPNELEDVRRVRNRASISQANPKERADQFRLISMVHQNLFKVPGQNVYFVPPPGEEAHLERLNQQMDVPEDEHSDG